MDEESVVSSSRDGSAEEEDVVVEEEDEHSNTSSEVSSEGNKRPSLPLDAKGRISLLQKLCDRMETNELFDDQDVEAVRGEIDRVEELERNSLRNKLRERLRLLTKFDRYLQFKQHHPKLNAYFVKKQKRMDRLAEAAGPY